MLLSARRVALIVLTVWASASVAQTGVAPAVIEAEAAFQDGRPAEALARLDTYLAANGDDAEAQYLLGRILYADASPVRDERRAARAIDRAVELDPDNVLYLVARLEGQRLERTNILLDLIRAQRRAAIARQILELDPDNAYAHEELGTWAIRDYYQYRNAIAFPNLSFDSPAATRTGAGATPGLSQQAEERLLNTEQTLDTGTDAAAFDGQDAAFATDRFDVDVLRAQNVGVVGFEARARRAYDRAIGHLHAALDADPRRRSVYDHVVRLALISGRWQDVAGDLREMDAQFPADARTYLYRGLAAQRTRAYDAAGTAFTEALRLMPPDERDTFIDLALILPPNEVAVYRADPEAFAERYWTSRDPRFLNTVNERQTEHYARLVEADLLYRSDALGRAGWNTERGLLHVRYGPPQTDVMIDGNFAQVVEAFSGTEALFEGVTPGASAAETSANRFNVWGYADGLRLVFEDPNRNGQFRLYSPPAYAYALRSSRGADRMDFVRIAGEAVRDTPERFTFAPPGRTVGMPARVTAFKRPEGGADVYVHYGVPLVTDASASASTGDIDLTIRTGTFLVGSDRSVLAERRRTVYGLRQAQVVRFAGTVLWTTTEALQAPVGASEVSVEFETADGLTTAVQRRAIDVPDFARAGLQISDVMLAYDIGDADGPGRVERGGVSILPAPWGVFESGAPVYLYVEVYGLGLRDERTDFEVEANLIPKDRSTGVRRFTRRLLGRRAQGVSATFEAQGARPDDAQNLQLDTRGQEPGLYTLTVTVRDRLTGATAERETDLLLEAAP